MGRVRVREGREEWTREEGWGMRDAREEVGRDDDDGE